MFDPNLVQNDILFLYGGSNLDANNDYGKWNKTTFEKKKHVSIEDLNKNCSIYIQVELLIGFWHRSDKLK